ncbi:MAG: hypothetical protein AAGE65_01305, partial [Planctomycetota bacterium]
EQLRFARFEFNQALDLRPHRVEPAVHLITVAMGLQSGDVDEHFERALAIDPYDPEAYDQALWAHRGHWGRNPTATLAIARRALASEDYHTGVPDWGRYAIEKIIQDYGLEAAQPYVANIWPELSAYLDRRAEQPTPLSDTAYFFQLGVKLAHAAGRPDDRDAYLRRLRDVGGRILNPEAYGLTAQGIPTAAPARATES